MPLGFAGVSRSLKNEKRNVKLRLMSLFLYVFLFLVCPRGHPYFIGDVSISDHLFKQIL